MFSFQFCHFLSKPVSASTKKKFCACKNFFVIYLIKVENDFLEVFSKNILIVYTVHSKCLSCCDTHFKSKHDFVINRCEYRPLPYKVETKIAKWLSVNWTCAFGLEKIFKLQNFTCAKKSSLPVLVFLLAWINPVMIDISYILNL